MVHKLFPHDKEEEKVIMKSLECSEEKMKEDVDAIMDWFRKQPHLVEAGIDPDIVSTFLLVTKGSREKAKRRIDNYYKYRGLAPEIIQSRIQALSTNQDLWTFYIFGAASGVNENVGIICTRFVNIKPPFYSIFGAAEWSCRHAAILKLYEGKRITIIQFFDPDLSLFSPEQLFTNLYMINDLRVKFDYFRGDIWVVDLKNASLGHLLKLNPLLVQKASQIFQEGLGFKVHAIHVLNFPGFGQKILNFFRNFVKAKIMDRVIINSSLEELHKVLPKQYLPKDYGGEDYSMEEYKHIYEEELRSEPTKQFLLDACKHVSDETKRPGDHYNGDCLAGTFKKLNID